MLVYCSYCVYNLFIRAGNRGRWPASVKLITLPYTYTGVYTSPCSSPFISEIADSYCAAVDCA